jgi:serine phosphatase RsbU (regulator of sigma subunit)
MNEVQELYTEDRLCEFLHKHRSDALEKFVRGIVVDVLKYAGKANQNDDMTVLSLEYRGMDGKKGEHNEAVL